MSNTNIIKFQATGCTVSVAPCTQGFKATLRRSSGKFVCSGVWGTERGALAALNTKLTFKR